MIRTWPLGRRSELLAAGAALATGSLLVALGMGGSPATAALPGLNGRIACDGVRGPAAPTPAPPNFSQFEVYTMNPDGSDLRLLTDNVGVRDLDPSYSPNGAKIAFDSRPVGAGTSSETFTVNADGSALERITFAPANDERTAWSPDGRNLTFMGGRDGNFNLFRIPSDGSDPVGTRLTTHPAGDFSPAWSPDGTTIAFDTGRDIDQNSEVYTMNAIAGDDNPALVRKLTNTDPPVRNWSANWSPDGRRIVFQSTRDGIGANRGADNFEIYTMNPDGSAVTRLTSTATNDPSTPINEAGEGDPAFSPDGRKIVFESNRSGDTEVYTMNADGSDVTRLTNSPGFDGRCDWQPIPRVAPNYPRPYPVPDGVPPRVCPAASAASAIRGTAAGNRITGTAGADRILAAGGNDVVDALAGNDCVDLGTGNDRGEGGSGGDRMAGGRGRDRMSGSAGNDRLRGGQGNDRLLGGRGNDRAFGDAGADVVLASFGNDVLHGVAGNDRLSGGRGRDRINGGAGNDRIAGGSSPDRVRGDRGNDRIDGNSGRDRIAGNSGNDRIGARDGARDRVDCGPGRDRVVADRADRVARNCERVRRR